MFFNFAESLTATYQHAIRFAKYKNHAVTYSNAIDGTWDYIDDVNVYAPSSEWSMNKQNSMTDLSNAAYTFSWSPSEATRLDGAILYARLGIDGDLYSTKYTHLYEGDVTAVNNGIITYNSPVYLQQSTETGYETYGQLLTALKLRLPYNAWQVDIGL